MFLINRTQNKAEVSICNVEMNRGKLSFSVNCGVKVVIIIKIIMLMMIIIIMIIIIIYI